MKNRIKRSQKVPKGNHPDYMKALVNKIVHRRDKMKDQGVGFMNITFTGFYDSSLESQDNVQVETFLVKILHKKRKDVTAPSAQEDSMGKAEVPVNPSENCSYKVPVISLTPSSFNLYNDNKNNSYILLLRVTCSGNHQADAENVEPQAKRRKLSRPDEVKFYGCKMTVFDRYSRCQLSNGNYESTLQELKDGKLVSSPKKPFSWEDIPPSQEKNCHPFEVFNMNPSIKFKLVWTNEAVKKDMIERPIPFKARENLLSPSKANHSSSGHSVKRQKVDRCVRIFYQFLYHHNTRQQTEAKDDYRCVWCYVNCMQLYSLLKHLKICHSRFNFTYTPHPNGARIDVSLNDNFDGSYSGNPEDVVSQPGLRGQSAYTFGRAGPSRRSPVSAVLVARPKRHPHSLSEFLDSEEAEVETQRPFITGHNRLYHHTTTCLPIHSRELDLDSEGENDPEWLRIKTQRMIDDFTDVNEGEKELMKMWNLHVMKNSYVGDCQISRACEMFLRKKGVELWRKRLYRNFVLHMANLNDFGLLGQSAMIKIIDLACKDTSMDVKELTAS